MSAGMNKLASSNHGGGVRGDTMRRRSSMFEGRFGRMFRNLAPASWPEDALRALGAAMLAAPEATDTTPKLPKASPETDAILQDDEAMAAYEGAFDGAMVDAWFERMRARYRDDGFGLWAVTRRDDDAMIGQCGLTRQRILDEDVLEVGYLFLRSHWRRGYATEAARALVELALGLPGVTEVVAGVDPSNAASVRVLEKAGLTFRSHDGAEAQYAVTAPR